MTPTVNIVDALADSNLLGAGFQRELGTWAAWRVALAALFGLPMTAAEAAIYTEHTGRTVPPTTPCREGWFIVGRRGGKSRVAACVAVFLACFRDYAALLAPGERGTLPVLAADRAQARTAFRYITGLLEGSPMLARLIERQTADSIDLTNRVTLEVHTASFRAVRGYTVIGAVLDEVAFWRSEDSSVNPDREIVNALRPAMATVSSALLVAISSPYARRGVLWEMHRRHHGRDGDVLVWQAPTRIMNPTVPQRLVDEALAADEASARAEYLAEFRVDVEGFVTREVLDACTAPGRQHLPPVRGTTYTAFVDPSGGAQDAMSLAIAHQATRDGQGVAVLDYLSARKPPFSPEQVVEEFCATLEAYGVQVVTGDRYGGEWPREQFRKHGINYDPSERVKSDLYRELLPLLTSGRTELLDHARLATELLGLERRTARGGRDSIDHGPGGHDDLANAAAGALVLASAAPTAIMLFSDEPGGEVLQAKSSYLHQIKQAQPDWFYRPDPDLVCGTCSAFEEGLCTLRGLLVGASTLKCDAYDPVPERRL
jgi:hypothetical protein